jgi:hypothetical protein
MTTKILCLFFSGRFKKGKPFPDPDAKIGYCTAKKLAFVGYRATIIIGNDRMPILDYYFTPANRHDSAALVPLLLSMEAHDILPCIGAFYGDNAYCTKENNRWLEYYEISSKFHTKDETGKNPKHKSQAKRKSRIRSKVESTFGIMEENYNFGATRVRGFDRVKLDTSLIFSAWNHFFLLSYFMDQFEDCISLRRLFYEH